MAQGTTQLQQDLLSFLRQQAKPLRSAQLQAQFQISQPTASRALVAGSVLRHAAHALHARAGRSARMGVGHGRRATFSRGAACVGRSAGIGAAVFGGGICSINRSAFRLKQRDLGAFYSEAIIYKAHTALFLGVPWLLQALRSYWLNRLRFGSAAPSKRL